MDFDRRLEGCELVITGEGRFDSQSIRGKVISGVSARAKAKHVPVVVIAGGIDPEMEATAGGELGISAVFSINRQAMDYFQSRAFSRENYRYTLDNILRTLKLARTERITTP